MINKVEQLAVELRRSFEEDLAKPFPYAGCRWLLRKAGKSYDGLIPDLDLYFSEIAGYCSWGKRALRWPREKMLEARERLEKSFFEKHPQYKLLEPMITEANTPDLRSDLALYERMRVSLLELLSELLSEQDRLDTVTQESTTPGHSIKPSNQKERES